MDAILNAFAGLLSKISDPVVIVLLLLLGGVVWMLLTEQRENRKDRNEVLLPAINDMREAMNDIKNAISALTGKVL